MKHLKTFDHRSVSTEAKINRIALRGVIRKDNLFLLILLTETNEYKFPGGGLEEGEHYMDGLKREVLEESGYYVSNIKREIGYVDQYHDDFYEKDKSFCMRSIYYECTISDISFDLNLDSYELDLGFKPVWVSLDEAIKLNKKKLENGSEFHWTEREYFMFKYLKNNYI